MFKPSPEHFYMKFLIDITFRAQETRIIDVWHIFKRFVKTICIYNI